MIAEQYNRTTRGLKVARPAKPKERLYLVATRQKDGNSVVTDIPRINRVA